MCMCIIEYLSIKFCKQRIIYAATIINYVLFTRLCLLQDDKAATENLMAMGFAAVVILGWYILRVSR